MTTRQYGDPPEGRCQDLPGRILMRSEGKWFTGGVSSQWGRTRDPCHDCGLLSECVKLDEVEDNSLLKLCAGVLGRDKVFVGLRRKEALEIMKTVDGASSMTIRDVFIKVDGTWLRGKDHAGGRHVCEECHIRDGCIEGRTTTEGLSFFRFCCEALPYGQCLNKADSTDITVFHGNARDWPVIQPPLIVQEPGSTGSPRCGEMKEILIRDDEKTWHRGPCRSSHSPVCEECSVRGHCLDDPGHFLNNFCCSTGLMAYRNFNRMTWNGSYEVCLLAGFRSARASAFAYSRLTSVSFPKSRAGRADGRYPLHSAPEILSAEPAPVAVGLCVRESGKWYRMCYTALFHPKFERKSSGLWDGSEAKELFWDLLDRLFGRSSSVKPADYAGIIQEIEKMESRT